MRSMRYTAYTYCLTTANHGEILTIGSRDKYQFESSRTDGNAELYIFRFADGRSQKQEMHEYELNVVALADCGSNTGIYMRTGDVLLGVSSNAGCSPYLYFLRPVFQRNPSTLNNLTNNRVCP